MRSDAPRKRRHPMIAFAGGVIAPGLGFWLTGRAIPALITAALAIGAVLLIPLIVVDTSVVGVERIPVMLIVFSAALRFGTAAMAAFLAFRDPPRTYKPFEHPWWAIGFIIVAFFSSKMLREQITAPHVVGFGYSLDTALAPTAEPGAMLVIVKRGFDASQLAINDVVAIAPRAAGEFTGFARVIALAGAIVEVDINGTIKVDGFPVIAKPCDASVPHNGRVCVHERQATTSGTVERYTTSTSFAREFTPTAVGPGYVFVLPDDRGRKLNAPAGLINLHDIQGRAVLAK